MKILVTAFEPFGNDSINPALEALQLISNEIDGVTIVKLTVPTVFHKSIEIVHKAMIDHDPSAVLCIGQAGGRSHITLERVAINIKDAHIADNEGILPQDLPVVSDGPAAFFSNLPIKKIVSTLCNHELPASISNSAGTYVCNNLMYGVLYYINNEFPAMRGGFIHVPFLPVQVINRPAGTPSMSLKDITHGLELALQVIIQDL